MNDEYLSRCVVDILKRKIYIYSNEGAERELSCETVEEFMNMLDFVRSTVKDKSILSYVNPI